MDPTETSISSSLLAHQQPTDKHNDECDCDYKTDDDDNDEQQLLLSYACIDAELQVLNQVQESIRTAWEAECELYGQTVELTLEPPPGSNNNSNNNNSPPRRPETVARRNYFHPTGTVQDPRLFPYHNSCYQLIDAYDCLYYNDSNDDDEDGTGFQGWMQPAPPGVVRFKYVDIVDEKYRLFDTDTNFRSISDPRDNSESFDENVPEFMPCSTGAIEFSLLGRETSWPYDQPLRLRILQFWASLGKQYGFWVFLGTRMNELEVAESIPSPTTKNDDLPTNPTERKDLLLKLLQHALSDLQRDCKLAAASLYALMKYRDLDDVHVFRRVLVILDAECRHYQCGYPCEDFAADDDNEGSRSQRSKHHCEELKYFFGFAVQKIFTLGITHITRAHAVCLAAFVRWGFLREFGSLVWNPQTSQCSAAHGSRNNHPTTVEGKRQDWLKRVVGTRRAELDDDVGTQIPVDLLHHVLVGVGERARRERHHYLRVVSSNKKNSHSARKKPPPDEETVIRRIDTYHNCVRALVHAAYSTIQILPENERFYGIAGLLLFGIVQSYATENLRRWDGGFLDLQFTERDYYVHSQRDLVNVCRRQDGSILDWELTNYGHKPPEPRQHPPHVSPDSLIYPFRYAAMIGNATQNRQKREMLLEHSCCRSAMTVLSRSEQLLQRFRASFTRPPPETIRTAIRGLYLKNLIDVRAVGFGYGDCLQMCRFNVNPLDPMLFWHSYAYPQEDEESSDDDDDEVDDDDRAADWEIDETGHRLKQGELRARYDLSLLLLVRAWQAPWTPESHASYSPAFRRAVQTVALCTYRLQYPQEVLQQVVSFLPRDAWPDPRQQCWSYDCCLLDYSGKASRVMACEDTGVSSASAASSSGALLKYCDRCKFSLFCANKDCYEHEFKAGHKRSCCRPPFLSTPPDDDELKFCVEIFKDSAESVPPILSRLVAAIHQAAIDDQSRGEPMEEEAAAAASMQDGDDNDDEWEDMDEDDNSDHNEDDGSWETMDSDENNNEEGKVAPSPTSLIYKYFKHKTYDHFSRAVL